MAVLLRIRNSGRVTISGAEFSTPLTFTFPGREVRDVAVIDGAGDARRPGMRSVVEAAFILLLLGGLLLGLLLSPSATALTASPCVGGS